MLRSLMLGRLLPAFLAVLASAQPGAARIAERSWTYREMFDKSDLVVIATGYSTKDTTERSKLLGTISVVGVETEFKTCLVLKGKGNIKNFILHHYRLPDNESFVDGPLLVEVDPRKHQTFLLFLVKEKDGRYAPVTGQTDPAGFCVLELKGAADPAEW